MIDSKLTTSFITTILSYIAGDQMPLMIHQKPLMPAYFELITFYLQNAAFAASIVAAICTVYFSLKNSKSKKQ